MLPTTSARQIQKPNGRLPVAEPVMGAPSEGGHRAETIPRDGFYRHDLVRSRRLELPRPFGHSDLNAARLPVPPRPHVMSPGREPGAGRSGASSKGARVPQRGQSLFRTTTGTVTFPHGIDRFDPPCGKKTVPSLSKK